MCLFLGERVRLKHSLVTPEYAVPPISGERQDQSRQTRPDQTRSHKTTRDQTGIKSGIQGLQDWGKVARLARLAGLDWTRLYCVVADTAQLLCPSRVFCVIGVAVGEGRRASASDVRMLVVTRRYLQRKWAV